MFFSTHVKNISQNGNLPQIGVKKNMLETTESTKHLLGDIDVLHWWTNSYLPGMSTWLPPQNWDVLDGLRNIPLLNSNKMSLPGSSRGKLTREEEIGTISRSSFPAPKQRNDLKKHPTFFVSMKGMHPILGGNVCDVKHPQWVDTHKWFLVLGVSELISLTGSSWWICARLTDVRISDGFQHIWPWLPISSEQTALGMTWDFSREK